MENYRNIYPLTYIENVLNRETGENLYVYLSQFNHINIGYVTDKTFARNSVPEILRKRGLYITYYLNDSAITEYFDGNKAIITENNNWIKDMYWKQVNNFIMAGATEYRPTDVPTGTPYFDTTVGKTHWWNGTEWITYPEDVKLIVKIKKTDIANTHRRCVNMLRLSKLPSSISTEVITFDKVKQLAYYDNDFYLVDADEKYYHDCHNVETAHIFVYDGDKFYYIEENKNLTEVTEDNIDDYILPTIGTECPEYGSVNHYADGTIFVVDKTYEVVLLVAFPTKFYGHVVEPPIETDSN
jgi:hypothetical protein